MFRFTFGVVLAFAAFGAGDTLAEQREPGVCQVTADTQVQFKSATIKCAKASSPGRFVIRHTVMERDDAEAYQERVRLAGQSFQCDLVRQGQQQRSRSIITTYALENCRR